MPEPHEMPTADFNSDRYVRDLVCNINSLSDVSIFSEQTHDEGHEWIVSIHVRNRRVIKEGEHLISVMWAALQEADKELDQFYEDNDKKRKAALAKLTNDDKQALGILHLDH